METKTVAVVDGRGAVHDFIVETLMAAGYAVRGFRSRATFLVEAPTVRPWIILLGADDDAFDVHTPLVMHSLRVAPYRPELPVILYSANPDAAEREEVEDEPDVLPLPTPFTAERLLDAVRSVAERSAGAPALTEQERRV
ncbi:MAG: hypothetical protein M3Y58_21085 [Chloroflexota bacterium]|nr:hypothetical protein [Chloroflexota bacterium]